MTKLSDSQLVVLSAACQRDDRSIYPLTIKAKGNAADKVLNSLLAKGLIEEVQARLDDKVWREDKDGARLTLRATDAAEAALGIETGAAASGDEAGSPKPGKKAPAATKKARRSGRAPAKSKKTTKAARKKADAKTPRASRENSKQARLIEMLKRAKGASIDEIVKAFDWQPHTVRGAIAGALKKKLGLDVVSEKVEGRGRVYRIATAA